MNFLAYNIPINPTIPFISIQSTDFQAEMSGFGLIKGEFRLFILFYRAKLISNLLYKTGVISTSILTYKALHGPTFQPETNNYYSIFETKLLTISTIIIFYIVISHIIFYKKFLKF